MLHPRRTTDRCAVKGNVTLKKKHTDAHYTGARREMSSKCFMCLQFYISVEATEVEAAVVTYWLFYPLGVSITILICVYIKRNYASDLRLHSF